MKIWIWILPLKNLRCRSASVSCSKIYLDPDSDPALTMIWVRRWGYTIEEEIRIE